MHVESSLRPPPSTQSARVFSCCAHHCVSNVGDLVLGQESPSSAVPVLCWQSLLPVQVTGPTTPSTSCPRPAALSVCQPVPLHKSLSFSDACASAGNSLCLHDMQRGPEDSAATDDYVFTSDGDGGAWRPSAWNRNSISTHFAAVCPRAGDSSVRTTLPSSVTGQCWRTGAGAGWGWGLS